MSDVTITLPNGIRLTVAQAIEVKHLINRYRPRVFAHQAHCGCCMVVHVPGGTHVIGADGDREFFETNHIHCEMASMKYERTN